MTVGVLVTTAIRQFVHYQSRLFNDLASKIRICLLHMLTGDQRDSAKYSDNSH